MGTHMHSCPVRQACLMLGTASLYIFILDMHATLSHCAGARGGAVSNRDRSNSQLNEGRTYVCLCICVCVRER